MSFPAVGEGLSGPKLQHDLHGLSESSQGRSRLQNGARQMDLGHQILTPKRHSCQAPELPALPEAAAHIPEAAANVPPVAVPCLILEGKVERQKKLEAKVHIRQLGDPSLLLHLVCGSPWSEFN